MTEKELEQSAKRDSEPPAGLSESLQTLWQARAGRWDEAHDQCQDLPEPEGSWIHAWLHRQEGDLGNASYWYGRANRQVPDPTLSLEDEWLAIAAQLLKEGN